MLVHLSVNNYAIVQHLDLELGAGMSVISGETGAGKSILLDALGLALGDRGDPGAIRPGADKIDILASFDIGKIPRASHWLAEHDLESGDQCLLRRVITAEGRSRGYINGTQCPLADLKALGSLLIDVHSQHEHHSLLNSHTHGRLLDEFAGAADLARQVQLAAQRWKQTRNELCRATQDNGQQQARQQLLSYQLEELEALALEDGELERLEEEHKALANAESLLAASRQVIGLCRENDGSNLLSGLTACLNRLTAFDAQPVSFQSAASLLGSAQIQVEEAVGELNRFLDAFDADPQRQQQLEERLDGIYSLARKHRIQPYQLAALQQQLLEELESLNGDDQAVQRLEQELTAYQGHYQQLAGELSDLRQQASQRLAAQVEAQIQQLGMPSGRFRVELQSRPSVEPLPQGLEQVEFCVSANAGQPLKALGKVSSGGELSRISLAIQVITAKTSQVPTLVFDEVDVGIGGATAEVVGRLLRQLGEQGQILTVTHLPQVAAQGHQHLHVHKAGNPQQTWTVISRLEPNQRVEEIARMLGGVELTEESLTHAGKMLDSAQRHGIIAAQASSRASRSLAQR